MPFLGVMILAVQIGFAVHVVRTGRPYWWLLVILMAPLIGCAVYFFAEVMPELGRSRQAQQAAAGAVRLIDPDRDLRRLEDQLDIVASADNKRAVAEEYVRRGRFDEAIGLYESSLHGVHVDDPVLLYGLARAQFGKGNYAQAIATLDRLKEHNPDFESPDGHLLYARSLDGAGRTQDAVFEYEALVGYFPGEEARLRYALLLKQRGEMSKAEELFRQVVRSAERGGRHYLRAQREWYERARQALAG